MKKFVLCAATAALALALVGCGQQGSEVPAGSAPQQEQATEAPAAEAPAAEATAPGPVTFTDDAGNEVTVDNPQRVVACMGSFANAWELAGGTLVGVSDDALQAAGWTIQSPDVATVGDFSAVNLEAIMALNPDFVIMTSGTGGRGGDRFGGPGMNGGMSSSSSGTIVISGGSIRIEAHGDGIDANGTLTISGGYVAVWGPTQGDTATLDYDVSGVITGGTFIGTGASGMAQTFSSSEQGVIAVSVGSQSAGTTVTVTDEDGNVLLSYEPPLSFSVVIYSSPELVTGQSYTIAVGSASGTFTAS